MATSKPTLSQNRKRAVVASFLSFLICIISLDLLHLKPGRDLTIWRGLSLELAAWALLLWLLYALLGSLHIPWAKIK